MTKPVTIPNTFATATTAIPLSNLDADFSTVATALNDANTYSNYAPDTGSANAYVVTLSGVSTTYSAGLRIQFKAGNANTTASTLNVNGGGAKNITYQDATAIASGTIAANSIVDVMYDGTQFLLMNDPAGATGGDVVGPSSATDNAIVRFDGTTGKLVQNSVVTIADSTGDISGVGQLNATTLDATNIEVTNIKAKDGTAAASIADSTGVISITSNPVLSGGTANGVLYLNGSKVATSGSALVFDGTNLGLGVTPSAWDTTSNRRAFELGYLGSGLYTYAQSNTLFSANAYFDGSFKYAYTGFAASYYAQVSGEHRWLTAPSGTAGNAITFTQAMTLDSSGNLGLGVTPSAWGSDRKAMQVNLASLSGGNGSNFAVLGNNLYNDGTNSRYITTAAVSAYAQNTSGEHLWFTAPSGTAGNAITFTQAMTLDASGQLSLGTTSPLNSSRLTVYTAYANNIALTLHRPSSDVTGTCDLYFSQFNASVATVNYGAVSSVITANTAGAQSGALAFQTANSGTVAERVRITSGGDLLVGTTTTASSGIKIGKQYGGVSLDGGGGSYAQWGGSYGMYPRAGIGLGIGSAVDISFEVNGGTEAARITSGGEVYIAGTTDQGAYNLQVNGTGVWGAGAYVNGSDERLKDNIQTLNDGLAVVSQLRPVTFQYKPEHSKDQSVQPGFIAQELQQTMAGKDYVDGVVKSGPEYLNVAYQNLIPILTKAIQEQQALITSLTARVALLEGN